MHFPFARKLVAGAITGVIALGVAGGALAINQSGEQKDMRRVGHTDLQGRAAYHPDFITYPGRKSDRVRGHASSAIPRTRRSIPTATSQAQSAEAGQSGRAERDDDRRHHRSEEPGREVPHSRPDPDRGSPDAIEPHVPGFGADGWRSEQQGLHDAQRAGGQRSPSRGTRCGTSPTSPIRRWSARCATFATRTSTGGSARPASRTCPAARARRPAVASGPVDGRRRLEESRRAGLPSHLRAARRATERSRTRATFAARSDLGARASQCGGRAGARPHGRRHHRQPHLPRLGCRRRWRAAGAGSQEAAAA